MAAFRKATLGFAAVLLVPALLQAQADLLRRQAYLGASLQEPTPTRAGAEVRRLQPGTAAAAAGLRDGDRVLKINGRLLADPATFAAVYGALRGGDTAELEVQRGDEIFTRKITLPPLPLERLDGVDVTYGSVLTDRGYRVRTILTQPKNAQGKLPAAMLVGWLSCNSPEWPLGSQAGTAQLLQGLATRSGYVLMRVDKPGVGDSEGPPCFEADFDNELAGYRAAFQALKKHPAVDPDRIFLIGISNGGGVAPLVPQGEKVRGYIVSGGWVKTWYEHMIEHERRRLALLGRTPGEISEGMRAFSELYTLYLIQKLTPGEAIRQRPYLAPVWYDLPAHQYGRPAAFYQQLQDLNLAAAWEKVDAPVLVIYGEHDWIMSRDDHQIIADIVNRRHPGTARFVAIPKMDHGFEVHDTLEQSFKGEPWTFPATLVPMILDWMKGVL